jgi:hypothetical protein
MRVARQVALVADQIERRSRRGAPARVPGSRRIREPVAKTCEPLMTEVAQASACGPARASHPRRCDRGAAATRPRDPTHNWAARSLFRLSRSAVESPGARLAGRGRPLSAGFGKRRSGADGSGSVATRLAEDCRRVRRRPAARGRAQRHYALGKGSGRRRIAALVSEGCGQARRLRRTRACLSGGRRRPEGPAHSHGSARRPSRATLAQQNLGRVYAREGVPKDLARAASWYGARRTRGCIGAIQRRLRLRPRPRRL